MPCLAGKGELTVLGMGKERAGRCGMFKIQSCARTSQALTQVHLQGTFLGFLSEASQLRVALSSHFPA